VQKLPHFDKINISLPAVRFQAETVIFFAEMSQVTEIEGAALLARRASNVWA
jgi:hypothetical protein